MADTKQKTGAKPSKRVLEPKKKKRQANGDEPTKEEYAVARFVRFKVPTKKTMFGHGMGAEDVNYFVGSKAVDSLMESKWSSKKAKKTPLFTDRQSCVDYMQQILMKGLFFRAKKLVPKIKDKADEKKKDQKKGESKDETPKTSPKAVKGAGEVKQRKKGSKDDEEKVEKEKDKEDGENGNDKGKEKLKSRKIKLDFHSEQLFIDGASIYVWKYDPTPLKHLLLGFGIVIGAIALCLFPLWPLQIRSGVYYLSLGAMGFFGAFIGLVVLRSIVFGIVWAVTAGRHHFWLFPNLTEDCGVLDSFKPWYSHKYYPPGSKTVDEKKKKDKKSDSEDEGDGEGEGGVDDEDVGEGKDDQQDDAESASDPENDDDQGKDVDESVTASQDDNDDKSGGSSDEQSGSQSAEDEEDEEEEEAHALTEKTVKKRKIRRDDGQESNNGDFEFVETPNKE